MLTTITAKEQKGFPLKITFAPALDLEGHPQTLTVVLNDGHAVRISQDEWTDASLAFVFKSLVHALDRHLKGAVHPEPTMYTPVAAKE